MASDFRKPNMVHTLFPEEIQEKMWPLPVRELFSVGKSSEKRLHDLGIQTIGDLAQTDVEILKSALKKHGEVIWNFANGRDVALVESEASDNKGYGNSTTIAFDVTDASTAKMVLLSLAENIGRRLRKADVRVEEVSVSIRYDDFTNVSHQCALPAATNITYEIHEEACRLFDELWDGNPIRLLGIQTGKVSQDGSNRQMNLFDHTDYEKLEKLDKAVDSIRERFGSNAIQRASFLKQDKIKHMTGKD